MARDSIITSSNNNNNESTSTIKDVNHEIHKLEVNLKRLIQSCEKLMANTSNRDMASVEKFLPVLFSKHRQLKDMIENANTTEHNTKKTVKTGVTGDTYSIPTKETMFEYARKIGMLVSLLGQEKSNTPAATKLSMVQLQSSNIPHSDKMDEVHTVYKVRNNETKKMVQRLIDTKGSPQSLSSSSLQSASPLSSSSPSSSAVIHRSKFNQSNNNNNGSTTSSNSRELMDLLSRGGHGQNSSNASSTTTSEDSVRDITEEQRKVQDEITKEMLMYTEHLKNQSNKLSSKLESDDKMIGEINVMLGSNRTKIGDQSKKLKDYTDGSSKDMLNYCLIIVVVLLVFMGTYMFMKITPKPRSL
ncbi:hypothetical protein SAMD00019534_116600 [Acytostelium subglobosum LB1]|uniref:hypothetical protein n=1 Tax=Acytostelium subglobosum LB1 TaxID=1410327 RepID=UPI000644E904|nr:hypothetical protein SAMD00019534_116600 [Acytostelium subglobosum LB1]GAM28484.1 hypothetical protein SAMD00019534_116600 [Acytostelium subglobosum LB1]|eukprot:XP_012748523.1 hypothetical protein SAMD00019534_116600 [Acytostelium subglobosum LB1]